MSASASAQFLLTSKTSHAMNSDLQLDGRLRLGEAQDLARVKLAKVDSLGDVGVGLSPVLADFEDQPRHEFHLALAHEVADAEDEARALFDSRGAPGFETLARRTYRGIRQ